jgi:hypothetical protein
MAGAATGMEPPPSSTRNHWKQEEDEPDVEPKVWSRLQCRVMAFCVFALAGGSAMAHGISPGARQRMIDGGNLEYIRLGAEHKITGYDHLLFLFGVMFFLTRVVDIIKFVSAFTIGHTITLILATYWGIKADYYLVDAFIALTVVYIAFQNLDGFPISRDDHAHAHNPDGSHPQAGGIVSNIPSHD